MRDMTMLTSAQYKFLYDILQNIRKLAKKPYNLKQSRKKIKQVGGAGKAEKSYKTLKKLGEGSFGKVYLVKKDNKLYAVKKIIYNKKTKWCVENEIATLRYIQNNCKDFLLCYNRAYIDEKKQTVHIETEYLEGYVDLYSAIFRPSPQFKKSIDNPKFIISLCSNLIHGLKLLFKLNVVHKDIKLENVLVNAEGRAKYIDFGLSCTNTDICPFGGGTDDYFPPEYSIHSQRKIHKLCLRDYSKYDLWSLGITIFEIIALRSPQQIFSKNKFSKYNYITQFNYSQLIQCNPEIEAENKRGICYQVPFYEVFKEVERFLYYVKQFTGIDINLKNLLAFVPSERTF